MMFQTDKFEHFQQFQKVWWWAQREMHVNKKTRNGKVNDTDEIEPM